jgi:hypothetical protein
VYEQFEIRGKHWTLGARWSSDQPWLIFSRECSAHRKSASNRKADLIKIEIFFLFGRFFGNGEHLTEYEGEPDIASVKCDICSVISFATRHSHQQQSTHSDNTRASCPLVAMETQIRKTRILSAHEGEVGVVNSLHEMTPVRVPESEHEMDQRLYTSWHGFGSRKGLWDSSLRVHTRSSDNPALLISVVNLVKSEAARTWNWTLVPFLARFCEWVECYVHAPLHPRIMRHGVRLTKLLHTSRIVFFI